MYKINMYILVITSFGHVCSVELAYRPNCSWQLAALAESLHCTLLRTLHFIGLHFNELPSSALSWTAATSIY